MIKMIKFGLSAKQVLAATEIALGKSHTRAAEMAQVTPQTISEWMKSREFKAKINQIQFDTMNEAKDRFRGLAFSAVNAIETILEKSKSEKMKLEAAKYVLSTIDLAPSQAAFWFVGPTTAEELETDEHVAEMQKRLKEIREEMNIM